AEQFFQERGVVGSCLELDETALERTELLVGLELELAQDGLEILDVHIAPDRLRDGRTPLVEELSAVQRPAPLRRQELEELLVGVVELALLRQEPEQGDDADDAVIELERHAGGGLAAIGRLGGNEDRPRFGRTPDGAVTDAQPSEL